MPFSYTQYTVDSSTASSKTFSIGFDYLRASHITTTVAGSENTDFTVDNSAGTLTFGSSTTLTAGQAVVITRTTPKTKATRVVDFADGSILSESALDDSALQLLYISQEAFDQSSDTMGKDTSDGQWDATSLRIKNLALPTSDTDAARKIDIDNAITGSGNLPNVDSGDNNSGLFVSSGAWATRTPAQSRSHLGLGTTATKDTGTGNGDIPLLDATGYPSINGSQITDILARGLSVAVVRWSFAALENDNSTEWEGPDTRLITGTNIFINNSPAGGGGSFFANRVGNDGIDIAAGKYLAIIPMTAYNDDETNTAYLKITLAPADYTGASTQQSWDIIEGGATLEPTTNAPHWFTSVATTYINASSSSSIALFAANGDASGNGSILIRGNSENSLITGLIIRIDD